MANSYFIGMRDDSEFVTGEVIESYRKGYLELVPNGDATLTALTALMKQEKQNNSIFYWWQEDLPSRRATLTAGYIYVNAACGTPYVSGGVAGQTVYAKITTAQLDQFRVNHVVQLRDADRPDMTVNAKITNVMVYDGTYSVVSLYLLEADDNATAISGVTTPTLANADVMMLIGNANPQGGTRPASISYGPTRYDNYAQIFRTAVDTTRNAEEADLRTEKHLTKVRKNSLRDHMLDIETGFLLGTKNVITGANGKREYYTDGLLPFIRTYGTVADFNLETGAQWAGQRWLDVGKEYMDAKLEAMFRYGSSERLVFCGSLALLGIQQLVDELGMYQLNQTVSRIGVKVLTWETVFGTVHFKRHPLMTHEATLRNTMIAFEPANMTYRYVTDTKLRKDKLYEEGAETDIDGRQESYITDAGLEFGLPQTAMLMENIGNDNTRVSV